MRLRPYGTSAASAATGISSRPPYGTAARITAPSTAPAIVPIPRWTAREHRAQVGLEHDGHSQDDPVGPLQRQDLAQQRGHTDAHHQPDRVQPDQPSTPDLVDRRHEPLGGALLAAGLATPLAAASLIGVMITAIRKVHLDNGPWITRGGYEYNLVLIAALLELVDGGPGALSLDRALGIHKTGPGWHSPLSVLARWPPRQRWNWHAAGQTLWRLTTTAARPPRTRNWARPAPDAWHQGAGQPGARRCNAPVPG